MNQDNALKDSVGLDVPVSRLRPLRERKVGDAVLTHAVDMTSRPETVEEEGVAPEGAPRERG